MRIIDKFLQEDMLIVRPSIFIYVNKDLCKTLIQTGMKLDKPYISCYIKRLPEHSEEYRSFMENVRPVRITLMKLSKINDQKVTLKCVNISDSKEQEFSPKQDHIITRLQRKYDSYIETCYKDHVPMENLPHIDLYLEKQILPGFVCKVL